MVLENFNKNLGFGQTPPPLVGPNAQLFPKKNFDGPPYLFNKSFLCQLRICLQFLGTEQIGATALTQHVKLGKATVTMIIIVREAQFVEETTARTFGHRPFMAPIAALQTHLQVSRVFRAGLI